MDSIGNKLPMERLRNLMKYHKRVIHALQSENLPDLISYRDLHKKVISLTMTEDLLRGRCKRYDCISFMVDLVIYFRLLIGSSKKGFVDIRATRLYMILLERPSSKRFVSPNELLNEANQRFEHLFINKTNMLTCVDVNRFIENSKYLLLNDGPKIAAQCAVVADRVHRIATLQPGIVSECLTHLYKETYNEVFHFTHFSHLNVIDNPKAMIEWAELEINGKLNPDEDFVPRLYPWSGILVQFNLFLCSIGTLHIFGNITEAERYLLIRARAKCITLMFMNQERERFDVYAEFFELFTTILNEASSHPFNQINEGDIERIFIEVCERVEDRYRLKNEYSELISDLVKRTPIGYCIRCADYLIIGKNECNRSILYDIFKNHATLVFLKGPLEDRILCRTFFNGEHFKTLKRLTLRLLNENGGEMEKAVFIQNFIERHNESLVHYDIWKYFGDDVRLVKRGIRKIEYIQCTANDMSPISMVKDLTTPSSSSEVTVQELGQNPIGTAPRGEPTFKTVQINEVLERCDHLAEKLRYDDHLLVEFFNILKWNNGEPMSKLEFQQNYALFVQQVDAAIVNLTVKPVGNMDVSVDELLFNGHVDNIPPELYEVFTLMYIRSGQICIQPGHDSTERNAIVDLVATRMLEIGETRCDYKGLQSLYVKPRNYFPTIGAHMIADISIEAVSRHPDRFNLNVKACWFETKFPHVTLMKDYIETFAGNGVPLECIAHLCYDEYGITPADLMNYYPQFKASSVPIDGFNEQTLKCLLNICTYETHFDRFLRSANGKAPLLPFGFVPNEMIDSFMLPYLVPRCITIAEPSGSNSPIPTETIINLVGKLFILKAQGNTSISAVSILQNTVEITPRMLCLASGVTYEGALAKFNLKKLSLQRFVHFMTENCKHGICLKQLGKVSELTSLAKLHVKRQNVNEFKRIIGEEFDVRLGNCFAFTPETTATEIISVLVKDIVEQLKNGRVKVEDLCSVKQQATETIIRRQVLPGWLRRLAETLHQAGLKFVVNELDELFIEQQEDEQISESRNVETKQQFTDEVQPELTDKKTTHLKVTINKDEHKISAKSQQKYGIHRNEELITNLHILLKEKPDGMNMADIPGVYLKRFHAQPDFGGNMRKFLRNISFVELNKTKLSGNAITRISLISIDDEQQQQQQPSGKQLVTDSVPKEIVDEENQARNIRNILSLHQDGVAISRIRDLYKKMFDQKIILPNGNEALKKYLNNLKFTEIVSFNQRQWVRLRSFTTSRCNKQEFERRIIDLLKQETTEERQEIGYELLCQYYRHRFEEFIPCSRQFENSNNLYELLKKSKRVYVHYNAQRTNVLLKLKNTERIRQNDAGLEEIRQLIMDFIKMKGEGIPYEVIEKEFAEKFQGSGIAFAEFVGKTSKFVIYRDGHKNMIRLKSMQVRPSSQALSPLVITLAAISPLSIRGLIQKTNFDINQFGFGQPVEFFDSLSDIFVRNKQFIKLKNLQIPDFIADKMLQAILALKTELKIESFGSYLKEHSQLHVNPRCLGFRNWEHLLRSTSFQEEILISVRGEMKSRSYKYKAMQDEKSIELSPSLKNLKIRSSQNISTESNSPLERSSSHFDLQNDEPIEQEVYDNIHQILFETEGLLFPETLLEEYRSRFGERLDSIPPAILLYNLAKHECITVQPDGLEGITMKLGHCDDGSLSLDEHQEVYESGEEESDTSEMENLIHLNENSLLNNCGTASSSENVQSFLRNFLSNYGQQVDLIDVNKQIAELEIISEYIDANM